MSIVFTHFTHEEMVAGIHAIAEAAEPWTPTLLVGIGRGGLTPAVFLSHRMGLPLVSIDPSTKIAQSVEDINDSGRTIGEIRAALAAEGAIASRIRFAVLLDNVRSSQQVDYRSRTIDRSVDKDWFVFPWEAMAPRDTLAAEAMEVPERLA